MPAFDRRKLLGGAIAAVLASVVSFNVSAKTPDGKTPSEETVCDVLEGKAWGLCNAYCEAMDCDDPNVHASSKACGRVADNFARLTSGQFTLPDPYNLETCSVEEEPR